MKYLCFHKNRDTELTILEAASSGSISSSIEDDSIISRSDLIELIEAGLLRGRIRRLDLGDSIHDIKITLAGKMRLKELKEIEFAKSWKGRTTDLCKTAIGAVGIKLLEFIFKWFQ